MHWNHYWERNGECDLFNDTQYHLSRSSRLLFLFYHDGDNLLLNDTLPLCAAPFLQMPGCLENSKLALFYPKLRGLPKSFAWLTGWLFFQMTAIFISYASLLFYSFFVLPCFTYVMMADFFSSSWHKWKKAPLGRFIPLWGVNKNNEYIPWFNFLGVPFHFLLIAPSCKVVWSNTSLCQRLDQFFCLSYHNYYLATVCSFLLLSKFPLVSEGCDFLCFMCI